MTTPKTTAHTAQQLPPDAVAYLKQAAISVAKEQQFSPVSVADMEQWLHTNTKAIAEEAIALQWNLLDRIEKGYKGGKETLVTILCGRVWLEANRRALAEREQFLIESRATGGQG